MDIKLASRIKELRKKHGFDTQQDFADALNVDRSLVKGWENEKKPVLPRLDNLLAMCDKFQCDLDHLVGRLPESTHDIHFVHEMTGLSESAIKKISGPQLNNTFSSLLSRLIESPYYENLITAYNHYLLSLARLKTRDFDDTSLFEEVSDEKVILSKLSAVGYFKQQVASVMNQICDTDYAFWLSTRPPVALEMLADMLNAEQDPDMRKE